MSEELKKTQQQLCSDEWIIPNVKAEKLIFKEDGTGLYTGEHDKNYTFTYTLAEDPKTTYTNMVIHINELNTDYDFRFIFIRNDYMYIHEKNGKIVFNYRDFYKAN